MNAYEYFAVFFFLRVIVPLAVMLAIGEWMRRHPIRFREL